MSKQKDNTIEQLLQTKTTPILEELVLSILKNRPQNLVPYMIEFLQEKGNITSTGLTFDEKHELEQLRIDIKKYRELEEHEKLKKEQDIKNKETENSESNENEELNKSKTSSSSSSDNDDEIDPALDEPKKIIKRPGNRTSVSSEAYGRFLKKADFKARNIPKKIEQIIRIKGIILSSFMFANLEKQEMDIVIGAMEEKRYKKDDIIIRQGENGDTIYLIEEGKLDCYVKTKEKIDKKVKEYSSGEVFGELALLYNTPRAATIKAVTDVILWSLDRETFNNIVRDSAIKKRELYESTLKKVEILKNLDPYELTQIADALKGATFQKDDFIIKEGELGDVFYILQEGECVATKCLEPGKEDTIVKEYKEGEYFGERALIKDEPRAANIIVKSNSAKVICLDKKSFRRLLGPIEDILKRNMEDYNKFIVKGEEGK